MPTFWFAAVLALSFTPVAHAALWEIPAGRLEPGGVSDKSLSGYLSPSILKGQVGIGLGINWRVGKKLSLEWGGVLPHHVADYGHRASFQSGPPLDEHVLARIESYGEFHLVAQYDLLPTIRSWVGAPGRSGGETSRFGLDGGLGISFGFLNNRVDVLETHNPGGTVHRDFPENHHKVRFGPRIQTTARMTLLPNLNARLGLAYEYYTNGEHFGTHDYDLDFGGVVVEPGIEWRF